MSDPIAVAILAKLTSFYEFNGDLTDAHGSNDIDSGLSIAGYETGLSGQRLMAGSRGYATLADPVTLGPSSAFTLGGTFTYGGVDSSTSLLSIGDNFLGQNEVISIEADVSASTFANISWAGSPTIYFIESGPVGSQYPVTISVQDSAGLVATSDQIIEIVGDAGLETGVTYDIYATWDGDLLMIYVNGVLRGTSTPPRPALTKTQALYLQVGNQYSSSNTALAAEGVLFCDAAALSASEVAWLWNGGARRTYAQIVAAAA